MASRRLALFCVCVLWWASGRKVLLMASVESMSVYLRYMAPGQTEREGHRSFNQVGHSLVKGQCTLKLFRCSRNIVQHHIGATRLSSHYFRTSSIHFFFFFCCLIIACVGISLFSNRYRWLPGDLPLIVGYCSSGVVLQDADKVGMSALGDGKDGYFHKAPRRVAPRQYFSYTLMLFNKF